MFDWNDVELANIIWGEAGESDDHIVPYPDQIEGKPLALFRDKKELIQKTSTISSDEKKNPTIKAERAAELDSSSKYDTGEPATEFRLGSWSDGPDPSSSNVPNADKKSVGTTASKNITKSSKNGSLTEETAQFNKDSEMFENPPEDGGQGDFVDYGWANIGSFDDLDRIFSNHDPVFADMRVGHANELWSPSKDVTSSPLRPPLSGDSFDFPLGSLRTSIDRSEIKANYTLDPCQPFTLGYEKLNEITSHAPQDVQARLIAGKTHACLKQLNDGTAATHNEFPGKSFSCVQANKQKRLQKGQKLDKKIEVSQLHGLSDTWTSPGSTLQQVNIQYAPTMINPGQPLVLTQQSLLQRPESFQQKHFPCAPLGSPLCGNMVNPYHAASVLPQFHPGEGNHELVSSSYEPPPSSSIIFRNSKEAAKKPPIMTPREKIEKLRKRQQMRAILAIQKQQLQFGNQVSVSDHSGMVGGNIEVNESLGSFISIEPNSPLEHYDSNATSRSFDNCSVEESVLYRLQDTIAKLDTRIRLCIRDSLFRLTQSAVHRQYPDDTSSTSTSSRDEILSNKDILASERFTRMPDVETDTNPIDRAVAHLLFHRPKDFTGKPAGTPELPLSATLPYEKKTNPLKNLTKAYFPENFEPQITSPQGSKSAGIFSDGNHSKNGSSEDASKVENTDGVQMKDETSI